MSKIKTMLMCCFDIRGIIYFKFLPEGAIVNQAFYVEVLKRLIDAMKHKQGELWRDHSLILHHDNATAHSSFQVSQILAGKGISTMNHPPHSPELTRVASWVFPKLKSVLKEKRFSDVEDIISAKKKKHIPVRGLENCFELAEALGTL
jgi:histone-lysine N-methyltransferase SETMAR